MIHRIDRVNPDVDDRVIKPNEARMAKNLRFGASTDDTNLSGGTLILGNKKLTAFVPPAGTNKVVGVYADLESRNVFFAAYNSNGNHGIYRINGTTDVVQAVVYGSWLDFQGGDEYNVSITGVDGKLYWTDNVNEPRMINVEKGIRTQINPAGADVYPTQVEPWHYTQIKRPPGQALEVFPILEGDLAAISLTKQNRSLTQTGFQYSYYYVYDNSEESRLAPFSINTFTNFNVTLTIPGNEFTFYTRQTSLIKAIVFVIRNGNDGVWRELRYVNNDGTTATFLFSDILATSTTTVSSDIVDARYDAVPRRSATNEIAQNRINHANYLTEYNSVTGMTFDSSLVRQSLTPIYNSPINRSFTPWGRYTIGVEFVDKYGRTQPVSLVSEVTCGTTFSEYVTPGTTSGSDSTAYNVVIPLQYVNSYGSTVPEFTDQRIGKYVAEYTIGGQLPEWVDRVNIVRSKCKNIASFKQSMGRLYLWYQKSTGGDYFFTWVPYGINPLAQQQANMSELSDKNDPSIKYTFIGYIVEFESGENFTPGDNQYIYFNTQYDAGGDLTPNNEVYSSISKFKVSTIDGNRIYIKASDGVQVNPTISLDILGNDQVITPYTLPVACYNVNISTFVQQANIDNYVQLLYNFTLTKEGNFDEQTLYTTEATYSAQQYNDILAQSGKVTGYVYGDMNFNLAVKNVLAQTNSIKIFAGISQGQSYIVDANQSIGAQGWRGYFLSMSPIDIYNEQWSQSIGQINTTNFLTNENTRLNNAICFSNLFIQGTRVNGLNKFNSVDFRQAPAENGPITSLVTTNATQREPGVLLAIGTFGVSSFYYDAIQLTNVDGSNNVTTTDSYLASQRPLVGQYGTARPMSVTKTPLGTVYWWSDVVNDMIRYSNAGLERLGNTYSFANYLRKNYNNTPLLITWYDQVTDEVNLIGTSKFASVFSERFKTFQGERDYTAPFPTGGLTPDRGIGIATKQYLFVNGEVYVTDVDDSSVQNNFIFGEFKNPDLTIVTNESPVNVKRWNQIKMFGSRPTRVILSSSGFDLIDSNTLLSYIEPGWWIKRKGDWEAAIRRASNTQGGVYAGKLMESRIIYSNFAFSAEGFEKLNFIEVKSNVSIVQ
jgi:hypothetical protein